MPCLPGAIGVDERAPPAFGVTGRGRGYWPPCRYPQHGQRCLSSSLPDPSCGGCRGRPLTRLPLDRGGFRMDRAISLPVPVGNTASSRPSLAPQARAVPIVPSPPAATKRPPGVSRAFARANVVPATRPCTSSTETISTGSARRARSARRAARAEPEPTLTTTATCRCGLTPRPKRGGSPPWPLPWWRHLQRPQPP